MFLAPKIFLGVDTKKFWPGIKKFGLVLTTVQNFAPIGRRVSEISRWNKKNICSKLQSCRKLSFPGGLINCKKTQDTGSYLNETPETLLFCEDAYQRCGSNFGGTFSVVCDAMCFSDGARKIDISGPKWKNGRNAARQGFHSSFNCRNYCRVRRRSISGCHQHHIRH